MKIVAITAYNRPTLLYTCLKKLSNICNIKNWQIYISIDPSSLTSEIVSVIESFSKSNLKINFVINDSKMGVRRNPYKLLQWCFGDEAELVLYLEDDVVVSSDCLQVAEAISHTPNFSDYYLCANLLTTTCSSQSILSLPPEVHTAFKAVFLENKFFSSLGIILNRHQFIKYFEPNWFNYPLKLRSFRGAETDGWDIAINDYLLSTNDLFVIQSMIPRISHQGTHGTHADYNFHKSAYSHIRVYEPTPSSFEENDEKFAIEVIRREDTTTFSEKYNYPYIKSYVNIIHEITDLQISNINIEKKLNEKIITMRDSIVESNATQFALLQKQLIEMELRLNKKSIQIAEKLSFFINRLIGRNQLS
ncbi:glycosyltransferase family 2 protein [Pseudanabaena sp. UWO311]|uniref:glycosyltransferase n=1 Tax=Pseudanabaena sp. UWO311 TaxID=2487337 RepID=UPI00115A837B|nr:glycosyltransferase [Pseudanabaena sp. UWO311]TYQ26991.1 glycosyltransferase family 2 protein [Pseudanabaena sp. UWO311]